MSFIISVALVSIASKWDSLYSFLSVIPKMLSKLGLKKKKKICYLF